jgi:hypothetical protein
MAKGFVLRPRVTELIYQVFDRPFHPEIIESLSTRCFERDGYLLRLHLTRAGHVIEWRCGKANLVEVLGDGRQVIPDNGQLFAHRVGGERSEFASPAPRISYQTCFQLERVPAGVYRNLDLELRDDGERHGVLHFLSPRNRLGLSPLSYVDVQARKNSLVIHAFHTFPSEFAIVKSQTLIEVG